MQRKDLNFSLIVIAFIMASIGMGLGLSNYSDTSAAINTPESVEEYHVEYFNFHVSENREYYFFNLSLEHRVVIDLLMVRCEGSLINGWISYNLSINNESNSIYENLLPLYSNEWISSSWLERYGNLPKGSEHECQFYLDPNSVVDFDVSIIIGYTIYH